MTGGGSVAGVMRNRIETQRTRHREQNRERNRNRSRTVPKLKTNRGAAKRFVRTASGKFKRAQSHFNHILTKKSPSANAICAPAAWSTPLTKRRSKRCCRIVNLAASTHRNRIAGKPSCHASKEA